jgi:hypothetical protein
MGGGRRRGGIDLRADDAGADPDDPEGRPERGAVGPTGIARGREPHMNRITAAAGPAGQMLHGMGLDIVMPLVTYYALHAFGADTWIALLASTVVSGVRTLWVAVRERRFNPFSSLMLIVFGVGLVLAFATGDPKLIILKDSAITGVVGLCFLASLFKGRPLTLEAQRAWSPSEAQEIDKAWRESPRVATATA